MNLIIDKTEKGREEIATRKHHLSPRLRSLLLLVDGKRSAEEILKNVTGLGLTAQSLRELIDDGFIETIQAAPEKKAADQFQGIYNLYASVKTNVGFQLKLDRAKTVDELRELRGWFLEIVLIGHGDDVARDLRERLDGLLSITV